MILLDTTVLVYALGLDHPLRDPCRAVIDAAARGVITVTTTPEVIQEFVHVRARRCGRVDAAQRGADYAELLDPLVTVQREHLMAGLALFERHERLGSFDAVLAAVALDRSASALVSADTAFGAVAGLNHVAPGDAQAAGLFP